MLQMLEFGNRGFGMMVYGKKVVKKKLLNSRKLNLALTARRKIVFVVAIAILLCCSV
jgi:hypothetical protein